MRYFIPIVAVWSCLGGSTLASTGPFPVIRGWTFTPDSIVYTPNNLWDIIDGAADSYLSYGFIDLHIGEYVGADSIGVRIELYHHSTGENAFGIYALERKADYHFVPIGMQAYREGGVLNFLSGTYYVKLSTHTTGESALRALEMIAEKVVEHLAQDDGWPPALEVFPPEGREENTEAYVAEAFLGHSFFRSAYTAQYRGNGHPQLFLIEYATAREAAEALSLYLAATEHTILLDHLNAYAAEDVHNGSVTIAAVGRSVCGIVRTRDTVLPERLFVAFKASVQVRYAQ